MEFFTYDNIYYLLETGNETVSALSDQGSYTCELLAKMTGFIPESPVTISSLADDLGNNLPFIGSRIIYMILNDIWQVLTPIVFFKLFKSLPGKFS